MCGHDDRERAKAQAEALALAFRRHERAPRARVTLGALFASYLTEVTPGKETTSQRHDALRRDVLPDLRFRPSTGDIVPPRMGSIHRRSPCGSCRTEGVELGKPVGSRIVAYDLLMLRAVLNCTTMAGDGDGGMLLERNPLNALGGWKAAGTLLTCYVAPDEGTQREARKQRRELRSG